MHPNGHLLFFGEIGNFSVGIKRPFVFFYIEMQNSELYSNVHLFFYNEIQNFESCTQTAIRISYKKIRNLTIFHQISFVSLKREKKPKIMISRYLFSFFYNEKRNYKHY